MKISHEEKINYLRIAAGIVGFHFKEVDLDKLVSVYDGIIEKEGKYSVDDASKAIFQAEKREEEREQERIKKELELKKEAKEEKK